MALFPQLSTGAVVRLPFARTLNFLTRMNSLPDLTEYRYADMATLLARWSVEIGPVTDTEASSLVSFFNTQRGKYGRFTFLDPLENLLQYSEDFTQAAWQKQTPGSFSITAGQSDPLGGTGASSIANSAAATNDLFQDVAYSPESQYFTGSVWLKAASPVAVTLLVTDGGAQSGSVTALVGTSWGQFSVTKQFASGGSLTRFIIRFPASTTLSVFGGQMIYGPGPGGYSKTTTATGVHGICRFDTDELPHSVDDFNVDSARVPVVEIAG